MSPKGDLYMEKKGIIKYSLDRIYYVVMNGCKQAALYCQMGNRIGYKNFDSSGISYKVEVIDTLQNVLKENGLEILLIGPNGQVKHF